MRDENGKRMVSLARVLLTAPGWMAALYAASRRGGATRGAALSFALEVAWTAIRA